MSREESSPHDIVEAHVMWKQLCALATTKDLSDQERADLEQHLAECGECCELYRQYALLAHEGLPALADSYTPDHPGAEDDLWDSAAAKARLLSAAPFVASSPALALVPPAAKPRSWVPWLGPAMAAVLVVGVGLGAYRLGQGAARVPAPPTVASAVPGKTPQEVALDQRLSEENTKLQALEQSRSQYEHEAGDLHAQIEALNQQLAARTEEKSADDQSLTAALAARDALQSKLNESQQNYQTVQEQLTQLRTQRQQELLHYASMEVEVNDLNHRLHDAQSRVQDDTQYLASDRDIRELMGARQLYIADVVDVDQNGDRRKPFGRVFYTQGKSLIFYAFDLDQQPRVKEASTFQAWAREGSDKAKPVSLGVFYVDSESNRRWALKASDPAVLAEINSVFVTVEPKGGSEKPTGKPLLYAYLRTEMPNHP